MNTCLTGHQSQAIKGCILWMAVTNVSVPDVYTSFLRDTDALWEEQREKAKMTPARFPNRWRGL